MWYAYLIYLTVVSIQGFNIQYKDSILLDKEFLLQK